MNSPTLICIARHGETDWNIQGVLQGWVDVAINARGRQQARELASKFAGSGFSGIHSSPLVRAKETAEMIAAELGLPPPLCHDGLKERHFGAFQGIPKAELAELNPVLFQQILSRNPACEFEQGETMDEFADRILAALYHIAGLNAGERVLLITHGWVMDVITRHIAGLPRSAILHMKRKNGECLWVEVTRQSIAALKHGDSA
ncbi:MAG: histidine phosphatase family protein [Rhodocyclaceae bacterium]|nr:histidine phosphatase family protein [Rhodocyclaceae bacterium]